MKQNKIMPAWALMIALFVAAALMPAPADAAEKPRRLSPATRSALVKSQEALDQEQYQKAREILSAYLKDHAQEARAEVYWLLGNTWFLQDNLDQACTSYRRGLTCFPKNASLHQNYAVACYLNRDFGAAGDHFVKAFELESENPDISLLFKAGSSYYNAENFSRAKQTLSRLIGSAAEVKPEWRKLLVHTHVSLEDWDAAETALTPLLESDRDNPDYWKLLAKLHLNRDDYKSAATALTVAYEIDSAKPQSWDNLAEMYFYLNAPLKAARCIEKGYGDSLSPAQYEKLARAYARALRYATAVTYIDKAIDKEPTTGRYKMRADFYYRNRQFQKALDSFETVIRHDPEDDRAHLMMGFCAMELDKWDLAQRAFSGASKSGAYGFWAKSALALVDDLIDAKKAAQQSGIKLSMR